MPFGAVAGGLAAGIGGSLVSGLMSPGTSGGGNSYYTPTGLGAADTSWQNLLNQQLDTQQNIQWQNPGLYQALQGGMYAQNQYSPAYQSAADTAGAGYGNLASTLNQQSQNAYGTQQSLLNAGQQAYQTSLDPQNALYNRTVQQLQDQTGATNSMYGLGSSAAGAGVANQALSNFNIDWQNQQLQRQLSGLQGYGQAAQAAGQYGQYGTGLAEAAPGYQLQAGQVPYQTAQGIAGVPGQLIGNYNSQLEQGPLSSASAINGQIIPYLNYGSGAQSIPYQSATQGAGAAGALVSQGIQGLGSNPQVQATLGGLFGGNNATGSFSGGNFGGAFNSNPYYSGGGNSYGFTMQ
jgi:hypothetical protein